MKINPSSMVMACVSSPKRLATALAALPPYLLMRLLAVELIPCPNPAKDGDDTGEPEDVVLPELEGKLLGVELPKPKPSKLRLSAIPSSNPGSGDSPIKLPYT